MLILTRRVNQSLVIAPGPDLDLATPIGDLFREGPIEIGVTQVNGSRVTLSIVADGRFLILRDELYGRK